MSNWKGKSWPPPHTATPEEVFNVLWERISELEAKLANHDHAYLATNGSYVQGIHQYSSRTGLAKD